MSPRSASDARKGLAGVRPLLALGFALLVALAPLAGLVRAQGAVTTPGKPQYTLVEDGPAYIIYQTPSGETGCRAATPAELENIRRGGDDEGAGLRQINHLGRKGAAGTEAVSAGLTIVLRGTAQLEANAAAKAAFIAAAAKWEAIISSPITVTIDVDYGTTFFGTAYSSANTLGATSSGGFRVDYPSVRQRLINRAPAGSEEAALLGSLPASSLPTDIGNVPEVFVPPSVMRALGLSFNESTAPVPRIGFNSNFAFDFDFSDGVTFNQTDFDSVAVHEIGHALGFNSQVGARELDSTRPLMATVWDFYRFRPGVGTPGSFSTAQRILTSGTSATDPHVHFGGGPELALSTGKPDGNGGDGEQASHWKDDVQGAPHVGIMDPTISRSRHLEITANDLKAIDFFGYSVGAVALPPAPANDNFASAQQLSGSTGLATGTNSGATKEAGEPSHSPDNNPGGKSVWYRWTAPSSGAATFTTGSSSFGNPSTFDTLLAVYTGPSVGALTPLGKNDDSGTGIFTSTVPFNAVGGTTYFIAVDGWNAEDGTVALSWSHVGTAPPADAVIQFSAPTYAFSETGASAVLTLTRSGNPAATVTVDVRTVDNAAAVACGDTMTLPGVAFARCDYATTVDTLTFAPGESSKTLSVPLINDAHGEPNESVQLVLSNPAGGAQLGAQSSTTLFITSDEPQGQTGAANPINGNAFFVRQHYLDFLSREPEVGEPWTGVLDRCLNVFNTDPLSASAGCDRLLVSSSFFGSGEFELKGRYAFRFYRLAFDRLPEYAEIVHDMRQLTGATGPEVIAKRAAFPSQWMQRGLFPALYDAMTNAQFVDTLMGRYNLSLITTFNPATPEGGTKIQLSRTGMTSALNSGQWTRAQVLRAIADSDEVGRAEFNPSFVAMQYYGYLRRTPEPSGYQAWLNYLNANPTDFRTMVNGFLNSGEYRLRFGGQ